MKTNRFGLGCRETDNLRLSVVEKDALDRPAECGKFYASA